MSLSRREHLYKARLYYYVGHYEAMVNEMKTIVKSSGKIEPLTFTERHFLSMAYQCHVDAKRACWDKLHQNTQMEEGEGDAAELSKQWSEETSKAVQKEINDLCDQVLRFLDDKLIAQAESEEAKVFFWKMLGDFNRYKIKVLDEALVETRADMIKQSDAGYSKAVAIAREKLDVTNRVRLGLVVNYSVFLYEMKGDRPGAVGLAHTTLQEGRIRLQWVERDKSEAEVKEVKSLLRRLKDNLKGWETSTKREMSEMTEKTRL